MEITDRTPRTRRRAPGRAALALALALVAVAATVASAWAVGEPVNSTPPEVTQNGATLSTTDGAWVGRDPGSGYTYAWLRCTDATRASCAVVAGRTADTYSISSADANATIRSQVTASNIAGSAAAVSAPLGPLPGNSPLAVPPPARDPAAVDARRLKPFPVVVIAGRLRGRVTKVTGFVVRGPSGARVTVRCRGKICPMRRARGAIKANRRLRLRRVQRRYRAGSSLEVRVTGKGRIGKFTRIRFRRGRTPLRSDACLAPGSSRPSSCD